MRIYHFSIQNTDGSDREETGSMALIDDDAARAFGMAIIRDLMRDEFIECADWTLRIAAGDRVVCVIAFESTGSVQQVRTHVAEGRKLN